MGHFGPNLFQNIFLKQGIELSKMEMEIFLHFWTSDPKILSEHDAPMTQGFLNKFRKQEMEFSKQ